MLSFAQPWFLLALLGLAAPVLIHRINRARPRQWRFPSLRFIQQRPLPQQGRRRVSDWLLLCLRCLLFAALVTALSRPTWVPAPAPASTPPAPDRFVLIDRSASMLGWQADAALPAALSRFFDTQPAAVRTGWALFADTILQRQPLSPDATLSQLQSQLRATSPVPAAAQPADALASILESLPSDRPVHIAIFSDFQASDWQQTLPTLPPNASLHLIAVGQAARRDNLAITAARALPSTSGRITVAADAFNFDDAPREVTVQFQTPDATGRATATIPPHSAATLAASLPDPDAARATASILDANDAFPTDDAWHFHAGTPPPLNVLYLLPPDADAADAEETFFFEQALSAASANDWFRFAPLPQSVSTLSAEGLAASSALFIPANQASRSDLPWPLFRDFVHNGGLLLLTLGNQAVQSLQNLQRAQLPAATYTARLGRQIDARNRFFVGPLPDGSLFADTFTGDAIRDLYLVSLRAFTELRPAPQALTHLQSEEGLPLLIEFPHGSGAVFISAFPWNTTATDLPLRPSFLPIVRDILQRAVSESRSILRADTRSSLQTLNLPANWIAPAVAQRLTAQPNVVRHENRIIEINVPRSESIPEVIPTSALARRLQPSTQSPNQLSNAATRPPIVFTQWLLLAAAALWLAESLWARRAIANASQP